MRPGVVALKPHLKSVLWGGTKLQRMFRKEAPLDLPLGESWEVSCVPGHEARDLATGSTLEQLFRSDPRCFLGHLETEQRFPLLVKFICTQDRLSLQVHPNDADARRLDGEPVGKREAWLVLDADPGAYIYLGLAPGRSVQDLVDAVRTGDAARVDGVLRKVPARSGDVFDLTPGTVHAPGPGILAFEIQQPSDLTYRLFDWGRLQADGLPRTLHLEKALEVIDVLSRPEPLIPRPGARAFPSQVLVAHGHFRFERWRLDGRHRIAVSSLMTLTCLDGSGSILAAGEPAIQLQRGASCVVPRATETIEIDGHALDLAVAMPPALRDTAVDIAAL